MNNVSVKKREKQQVKQQENKYFDLLKWVKVLIFFLLNFKKVYIYLTTSKLVIEL